MYSIVFYLLCSLISNTIIITPLIEIMNFLKFLLALLTLLFIQFTSSGQPDLDITGPAINPNPLVLGEQGQIRFGINNVNGSYPEDAGTKIRIEFSKVRPVNGVTTLRGINSDVYEWSYDEEENTIYGVQQKEIGFLFDAEVIIDIIAVEFTPIPGNSGFSATAYDLPVDGNTTNNFGSSYTWTEYDDYGVAGTVFHDVNQNQIQDDNEFGVEGIDVDIAPEGGKAISNKNGSFIYKAEEGQTYTMSIDLDDSWLLTTPNASITHTFENGNPGNYNNDFGIVPVDMSTDLFANLSSDPTICNRAINYKLRYLNRGTDTASGELRLALDPKIDLLQSSEDFTILDDFHVWDVADLSPNESKEINLYIKMPTEEQVGNIITMDYSFVETDAGNDQELFADTYESTILCAYDPNDKIVIPAGEEEQHYTIKDQALQYTVRFQNTGNAPAKDVIITDEIDPNLDLNTFRVINSSEDVKTSVLDRTVTFLFENIYLIDSLTDEPNSHGFISYNISPLEGVEDFTVVENTAEIFFDNNPPIGTNTTLNTLVDQLSASDDLAEKYDIELYPNPTSGIFQISSSDRIEKVEVYTISGQSISMFFAETKQVEIDLEKNTPPGVYYVKLKIADQIIVRKIVIR